MVQATLRAAQPTRQPQGSCPFPPSASISPSGDCNVCQQVCGQPRRAPLARWRHGGRRCRRRCRRLPPLPQSLHPAPSSDSPCWAPDAAADSRVAAMAPSPWVVPARSHPRLCPHTRHRSSAGSTVLHPPGQQRRSDGPARTAQQPAARHSHQTPCWASRCPCSSSWG